MPEKDGNKKIKSVKNFTLSVLNEYYFFCDDCANILNRSVICFLGSNDDYVIKMILSSSGVKITFFFLTEMMTILQR